PPIHLTPGTYQDTLTVSDPGATNNPQTIALTLVVHPPTIQLSAVDLAFSAPTAGPNPTAQTVNLTNTGPAPSQLTWTASSDRTWLRVTPTYGLTSVGTSALSIQPLLTQTELWPSVTSAGGAPAIRTGACAVWTGKEMIVWAGQNSGGFLSNGGRYNPATNTWTAMTTTNAPGARDYASAVWTGREMIIWGGYNGTQLPDGARYNPFTDCWSIGLSNVNRPAARYAHSAVWTGTEMLIWGGDGGAGPLRNGNRYNPASNTWTGAIPTTAAPAARSFHSAVWTGTEMIVWGGKNGSVINSGARFNPASNTWTGATSIVGAPAARSGQTAVWDGAEMIVWGGDNGLGTFYYNDGMHYNPASDTWVSATTTASAPVARGGHAGVWSGSEMIVWGGYASGVFRNDGARYQPAVSLAAGLYRGTITVSDPHATNNPQTIAVSFSVSNTGNVAPVIDSAAAASPDPVVDANTTTVSVSASDADTGPAALTYTWWKISGPGAVTFSPNGTAASDISTATFSASGTYDLGVSVSDGATIVTDSIVGIVVTLNPVTAPVASLSFTAKKGSTTAVSQSLTLTNTSGSALTVTLSDGDAWLSETALGGGAPSISIPAGSSATFTVIADPTGLNGVYNGTLTITNTPGGATQTIAISFSVQPGAATGGGGSSGCAVSASGWAGGEWVFALGLAVVAAGLVRRRGGKVA
ncbi:MAG TPA: hypothetical protein VL860_02105, partial [Planctomycetota bacterium]|nr:hypothetical protein [Planctomycetota bacterium]